MAAPDDPTQETSTTESMQRLERAIAAYLDFQSTEPPQDRETWLAAHPDLRDLLEPMLDGDPEPVAEDPVAGRQLGDFELVRRIGTGGMGVVYEAEQCSLGRRVALKLLRAHLSLESRALARFRREATIIASLEHPGIVKVLAVGEHEGAHFFAMELVDGVPLNKVITQISGHDPSTLSGSSVGETVLRESLRAQARPDPQPDVEQLERVWSKGYVETVVSLMAQVAQALGHAHDQGVVHRDVKPSNILVRRDGRAVLTDFGVARVDDLPGMTLTGEFAGSPHYVAPEQAMAKRVAVDHRADIFSLGATLYELLTLRLAFPGETNQEVLARIVTKDPVDPQKLNPKLAPDLAAIVMKALEKDPDRRYANARAFAEDLESFLSYRPVQARRVSMRTRVLRTVRREPLKAALIAVLLLAVPAIVGMGGYLLAKSRSIEVGDQTRREEETERRLATAYHQLHEGLPSRAVAQFAAILADDPSVVEARVGQILALLRSPSGQQRARELIGTRSNALPGIEQLLVRRARGGARPDPHTSDLELPAARTSAEYFLQAMVYIELGELGVDAWFVKAYEMLSRALLLSHRVPRYYLTELTHVAGHLDDAVLVARHAAALEARWPNDRATQIVIARAMAKVDPEGATKRGNKVLVEAPNDRDAWMALGRALTNSEKLMEGEQAYRKALALGENKQVRAGLAYNLALQHRFDDAIELYQRTLAKDPGWVAAQVGIAEMQLQAQRFDEAWTWARKAVEAEPRNAAALRVSGRVAERLVRLREAEELLRKAVAIAPDDPVTLVDLAWVCNRQQRPHDAIEWCRVALRIKPDSPEAWGCMGHAMGLLDRIEDSIRAYRKAVELREDSAAAQTGLAAALQQQGKFEEARVAATRAVEIDPKAQSPHALLGGILRQLGRLESAESELRRAIEIEVGAFLPHYELGRLLQQRGRWPESRVELEKCVELDRKRHEGHLLLGVTCDKLGDSAAARRHYEEAVRLKPRNAEAQYQLGAFLFRTGDRSRALACFQRAVWEDPDHALAQVNAGQILLGTGRRKEALPYLRRAHALSSGIKGWRYPTAKWIEMAERGG